MLFSRVFKLCSFSLIEVIYHEAYICSVDLVFRFLTDSLFQFITRQFQNIYKQEKPTTKLFLVAGF